MRLACNTETRPAAPQPGSQWQTLGAVPVSGRVSHQRNAPECRVQKKKCVLCTYTVRTSTCSRREAGRSWRLHKPWSRRSCKGFQVAAGHFPLSPSARRPSPVSREGSNSRSTARARPIFIRARVGSRILLQNNRLPSRARRCVRHPDTIPQRLRVFDFSLRESPRVQCDFFPRHPRPCLRFRFLNFPVAAATAATAAAAPAAPASLRSSACKLTSTASKNKGKKRKKKKKRKRKEKQKQKRQQPRLGTSTVDFEYHAPPRYATLLAATGLPHAHRAQEAMTLIC